MSALTNFSENLLLNWLMTNGAASRPTTWYVGLFTAAPSDAGGGTEVSGGGYARQAVTFNAAVSGATANAGEVSFTATGGNFGTVTHMAIFDAASSGNMLWHGALTASRTVNNGDTLTFPAGDIDLTLD